MLNKTILVTGSAGFIGFHLSKKLLDSEYNVLGLDGFTDYYDVNLKKNRNDILESYNNYSFHNFLIEDKDKLYKLCSQFKPNIIIHLAAQAGVRYSITNPKTYFDSNLLVTFNVLDIAKTFDIEHLMIASTSSVYGSSQDLPFFEMQKADEQLSFYAATKKACEVMAHSYSHIYNLPTTIFRFFTVYGPWGRPDMALYKFTKLILNSREIEIYNNGDMKRDFTYIDDLVKGVYLLIDKIPKKSVQKNIKILNDSKSKVAPYRIVNIGNSNPINLIDYVRELEINLGISAKKKFVGMQKGDVKDTFSDVTLLKNLTNFIPNTPIKIGIKEFVKWYKNYYEK